MSPRMRGALASCSRVHLRHRGQYSLERLCALKDYCERTHLARAAFVCVIVITPALFASVVFDTIPLQDPSTGWQRNSSLWIRTSFGVFLLTLGIALQLKAIAPNREPDVQTSGAPLLARFWVFPTPFSYVFGIPPWFACFTASTVRVLGLQNLRDNRELRSQIQIFVHKIVVESTFLLIYPLYNALFLTLAKENQFGFVFAFSVIKFALKRAVAHAVADVEELVPVVMISVDVFNALYQSKCMQSAGSLWTTLGIIGIDAIQNVYSLRSILRQVTHIESLAVQSSMESDGILAYVLHLAEASEHLDPNAVLGLQVRSKVAAASENSPHHQEESLHQLSVAQRVLHLSLAQTTRGPTVRALPGHSSSPPAANRQVNANAVIPVPPPENRARDDKSLLLAESVKLLWRCELVLLVEFFESAIPFVYAVYLAILYLLPNAKYYPGMQEPLAHPDKFHAALSSILVFATLGFASLLHVHAILKRKFKLSGFHQLAFVFENEWLVVQGTLIAWLLVVLQFTLEHSGMDFTFQFDWIKR